MSFSHEVKKELSSIELEKKCCIHAQAYGLALFGRLFSKDEFYLQTDYQEVANRYCDDLFAAAGIRPSIVVSGAGKYAASIQGSAGCAAVLEAFGHARTGSLRINRANLADDCCAAAFIRGAFLACGTVTSPEKDYHFEFAVPYANISKDLIKLLQEYDFQPKLIVRKGVRVVYFKDSESIEDILTFMGAGNASLEMMGIKMYKDMRNNINRKTNFETANITRTVDAAVAQTDAIRLIAKKTGLESLSPQLREIAQLRLENPEMSLRELGEALEEPISRSGVNHRLKRLVEIARQMEQ